MKLGNWTLTAVLFCFFNSVCASEVYTWKDQDGVTHFSEVPPAQGNSELVNIEEVYPPGSTGAYPESQASDSQSLGDDDDLFTESGDQIADQRREQIATDRKTRQEERAEMEKLCRKNEDLLARMEPARRVVYTNDQGERVRMNDDQRIGMIDEMKDFVAKNCK